MAPGDVRVLDICVSHMQCFVASVSEGGLSGTFTALDRSPEVAADRVWWTFAIGKAVNEVHLGRVAKGFRQLNAVFAQHQFSLCEGDVACFFKLTTTLALLSDQGLAGLDTAFLGYISNAASVVMSPSYPFAVVTRQLQALGTSTAIDMAWHLLARYADMVWQPRAGSEQPTDLVSQLSWDMSRSADQDYTALLSKHPSKWN